jgi:predicted transposase YbfD/YdcC
VFDLGSLYDWLGRLPDCRHARGVRYSLVTILVYVILAKLAGEDQIAGIAHWVELRKDALARALHLCTVRAPHRTTYSRILGHVIGVEDFEHIVRDFFASQPEAGASVQICMDGKTMRGTIPAGQSRGLHLLGVFLPAEGWMIVQVEVDGKENEITAAPRVLSTLDLRGKIVSGDAIFAQRNLSVQIVEGGGHFIWTVKDNQVQLRQDIATLFEPETCVKGFSPAAKDLRTTETIEKGHGRLERRRLTASAEMKGYLDWPYAEQVYQLERHVTRITDGKITQEVAYGVTSLTTVAADAARLLWLTRGHWGIENGSHYRRDQTLREDWCQLRTGHAAHMMSAINNLILKLLLGRGVTNVPAARRAYNAQWTDALPLILRC